MGREGMGQVLFEHVYEPLDCRLGAIAKQGIGYLGQYQAAFAVQKLKLGIVVGLPINRWVHPDPQQRQGLHPVGEAPGIQQR